MKKTEWSYELVLSILNKIADTPSSITKKMIIATYAKNQLFQKVVKYALDPFKTFKMSGTIAPIGRPNKDEFFTELFDDLESFTFQHALTKEQKEQFTEFVQGLGDAAVDLVNRILNKDLRCGANIKTFRNVALDCELAKPFLDLPLFHPMKGESDVQGFMRRAGKRSNICWSYKLDGTRCWAIIDVEKDHCLYLSFNGLEIPNFKCFDAAFLYHAKELVKTYPMLGNKIIYDGEVVNIQGDFSKHMSEFRRLHNMDASGFRFRVFDVVVNDLPFKERYESFLVKNPSGMEAWYPFDIDVAKIRKGKATLRIMRGIITYIPHFAIARHPMKEAKEAKEELKLEGIMLKTWDHFYQNKRSWDWCKVKVQYSEDLEVISTFKGTGKYINLLGGLIVDRAGVKVKVGSGFSDEERLTFLKQPPKIIEVEYQEVTEKGALRFPRFKRVRDDK